MVAKAVKRLIRERWQRRGRRGRHGAEFVWRHRAGERFPRAEQFLGGLMGLRHRRCVDWRRLDPDRAEWRPLRDALGLQAGRPGQPLRHDDRPGLRRPPLVAR
jgi:hypothetical protein